MRKGCCTSDARLILFENGLLYCKLTGANVFKKGSCSLSWLRWEFIFAVCWLKVLNSIKVLYLSKNRFIWKSNPFPQPHSFPLDVRHNLLFAKESAMDLYKVAYPFVQGLEFAAVQIIAVDIVRNSGFCKAGYIMNTGNLSKNNVSTGDLNRPRESRGPQPFGYFWFFS